MAVVAPPGGDGMALDTQKVPPNQSIYIQNLPDRMQKDDLRRELYVLFSTYGPVIDITALKTPKMRGQAHILFKDVQCATQALRGCQGFEFFGKELKISYSKNRSNTLAKLTGTFNQPVTTEQPKQIAQPPSSFPPPPGVAAPSALPGPPAGFPPPSGLPAKPPAINGNARAPQLQQAAPEDVASPQGMKRARDESDDEDAPMDEDDDEGEMEMSDDDD